MDPTQWIHAEDPAAEFDEELPDYEPNTAPVYDGREEEAFEAPHIVYHLRAIRRKEQILVPFGPTFAPSYKIRLHPAFRLFSKKPDIELSRTRSPNAGEDSIGFARFVNDGPLPWRPRAQVSLAESNEPAVCEMESRNFSDWTTFISGRCFLWRLDGTPFSLVFGEKGTTIPIARFTYSKCGTLARDGAEVGELVVYRDALSTDSEGVEKIVLGLLVAMEQFKRMGRHYWNDPPTGENARSHLRDGRVSTEPLSQARTGSNSS